MENNLKKSTERELVTRIGGTKGPHVLTWDTRHHEARRSSHAPRPVRPPRRHRYIDTWVSSGLGNNQRPRSLSARRSRLQTYSGMLKCKRYRERILMLVAQYSKRKVYNDVEILSRK